MKILLRLLAYLNRYKKQMLITYVCLFGIIGQAMLRMRGQSRWRQTLFQHSH